MASKRERKNVKLVPFLHLTVGMGDPNATHFRVRLPPSMTSERAGGGIENCGATLLTVNKDIST